MRRVLILVLLVALGLSAELWVNAIRDPSAELGVGDWEIEKWSHEEGGADSARVDVHDSSRAYEGKCSFLTDTKTDPQIGPTDCFVTCAQVMKVPKAVQDIDSCFWSMYLVSNPSYLFDDIFILFRSSDGKNIRWVTGIFDDTPNDTLYSIGYPTPDTGIWTEHGGDLNNSWISAMGWSALDTIIEVQLNSWGLGIEGGFWYGQKVFWDNVVLRSIAYYDYAAESIDSDPWEDPPSSYTPIATFGNKGKLDDFSTYVFAEIYRHDTEVVVFKDSTQVSIPSDGSKQVTFATYEHDGGSAGYTLRVFPMLENDELADDDTLILELMASITEEPDAERLLTTRRIDAGVLFTFTPEISGQLSIYDASGREVHSHIIESGIREHLWSAVDVSSGLYFYKLSGRETEVRGKLVILHRLPLPLPSSKGRR
jgi:hypothetical protein